LRGTVEQATGHAEYRAATLVRIRFEWHRLRRFLDPVNLL
jgi:hypothetical protein